MRLVKITWARSRFDFGTETGSSNGVLTVPAFVELLGRLGAQDDATVLAAARELNARVSQSGLTWDELLRANLDVADADAEHEDALGDETEAPAEQEGGLSAADKAEALRLIDRLLARKTLSSTLREDLADLKRGIADGSFDAMDSRYVARSPNASPEATAAGSTESQIILFVEPTSDHNTFSCIYQNSSL